MDFRDSGAMSEPFTFTGTDDGIRARKGYHHGHLREALVAAAAQLIAEKGPQGFTLVEAARMAGVSPAAPYRHFKDRDALIQEVASRGFAAFGKALGAALASSPDPKAAFERMGEAYLDFAHREPGFYGAMFFAKCRPGEAGAEAARPAAFETLAEALARALPPGKSGLDPRLLALQIWALSHGIAALREVGQLPQGGGVPTPDAILRSGVAALIGASVAAK